MNFATKIFTFENDDDSYCNVAGLNNDEYIGYTNETGNIFMIIISFLGIAINLSFFIISIKKIIISNKQKNNNVSSIEKILCAISLTETFISICWLINSFFMKKAGILLQNCIFCRVIGLIEVFLYLFDWMILVATLIQIKNILLKPLDLLKTGKFIFKYIIFSLIFTIFNVIFGFFSEVEGVSPMLTCFIRMYGRSYSEGRVRKLIFYIFFLIIPCCILLYGIYQVIIIIHLPQYEKNQKNKRFFRSYLFYVLAYIILALLLISVYIINYFIRENKPDGFLLFYIRLITFISCSTPLIVGTIRLFKTNIIKRFLLCKSNKNELNNEDIDYSKSESLNMNSIKKSNNEIEFIDFEKDSLCKEFKTIFIGISYVLDKYKNYSENEEKHKKDDSIYNINSSLTDIQTYHITKNEILKDLDLLINEDKFVLEQEEINIKLKVYSAKFFKKLREIDGLDEEQIIKAFQPKNVTENLIKKIKDDSYYINSINKQFILKNLKIEKINYYQQKIMNNGIDTYLENNQNSLICRIYGLFEIQIDDNKIYHIALMDNIHEFLEYDKSFKKEKININEVDENNEKNINQKDKKMYCFENEIDEKISSDENSQKSIPSTRKQSLINFNFSVSSTNKETIFKIILNENEITRLRSLIEKDVEFLHGIGVKKVKFMIIEKTINDLIAGKLESVEEDLDKSSNSNSTETDLSLKKIHRYLFKSKMPNIIYCISIIGYYNNYSLDS